MRSTGSYVTHAAGQPVNRTTPIFASGDVSRLLGQDRLILLPARRSRGTASPTLRVSCSPTQRHRDGIALGIVNSGQ